MSIAPRDLLPTALEAVNRARKIVLDRLPGTVRAKSDRNPVTEVDYAVERTVRDFLLAESPEIGFLGEEDGRFGGDAAWMWALDPVDGTVNFVHGIPLCGISLGLIHDDRPVLGVIDLPFLGIRYSAFERGGAFRGADRIALAGGPARLADAVVALGDYAVGADAPRKNAERLRITQLLAGSAERVRMFGSAAIDLAWVADGRIDASVMLANKPWDTSAGVLVAREAGAVVVDREGAPHTVSSSSTVAVAPGLLAELLSVLRSA